jgi:hypothetical protein
MQSQRIDPALARENLVPPLAKTLGGTSPTIAAL